MVLDWTPRITKEGDKAHKGKEFIDKTKARKPQESKDNKKTKESGKNKTLQMVTLQVKIELPFCAGKFRRKG